MAETEAASEESEASGAAASIQRTKSTSPTPTPNTIHFSSGNPSVEITEGIIHLYKDKSVVTHFVVLFAECLFEILALCQIA